MNGRVGVIRDFREENWPSMELAADMLLSNWPPSDEYPSSIDVAFNYRSLFSGLPVVGNTRTAATFDRARNRFLLLPAQIRAIRKDFEYFHIVDHSYSHLLNSLPPNRCGVYCHDLDAFRCLLDPENESRPWWFRRLTQHILTGFKKASLVFHSTAVMGENILALDLVPAERLRLVPLGVAPEFFDFEKARPNSNPILEKLHHGTFVLHVGSCIRRKRIDVLLKVFKQLRADIANLRLVKVGDSWTTEQERMIDELEIAPYIDHLGKLTRTELAFVYQHASATLVPSSAEGFGLPVIEALACGGPVVASDLPTLREAGGEWANYATTADTAVWTKAVYQAISANTTTELRRQRRRWAQKFSWSEHARRIAQEYSNFSKYTSGSPSRLRGHLNGT